MQDVSVPICNGQILLMLLDKHVVATRSANKIVRQQVIRF